MNATGRICIVAALVISTVSTTVAGSVLKFVDVVDQAGISFRHARAVR